MTEVSNSEQEMKPNTTDGFRFMPEDEVCAHGTSIYDEAGCNHDECLVALEPVQATEPTPLRRCPCGEIIGLGSSGLCSACHVGGIPSRDTTTKATPQQQVVMNAVRLGILEERARTVRIIKGAPTERIEHLHGSPSETTLIDRDDLLAEIRGGDDG